MYALTRRLLFALPPESAHALALKALAVYGRVADAPGLGTPVEVAGIRFRNRLGLAAGLDKDAVAVRGLAALGFGFVEVGTVTPEAQPGNPKPRLFRLEEDQALINRMGFNNAGVDAMRERLKAARPHVEVPVGVNIGKNRTTPISHAVHDYRSAMTRLYGYADYLTVNLSSPNTPGLRDLQSEGEARRLLATLADLRNRLADDHQRRAPIFVKIAPDLDADGLAAIASVVVEVGCDGVIATNTTVTRPSLANEARAETGGLSGVPLHKLACAAVATVRRAVGPEFPIIGVGGISNAASARAMIESGADLIQIYTALIYQGPRIVKALLETLPGPSVPPAHCAATD